MSGEVFQPQPPRCCVLTATADVPPDWHLLHANGNEAVVRAFAETWMRDNPGRIATLLLYAEHGQATVETRWTERSGAKG